MVHRQEKSLSSRRSTMAKTVSTLKLFLFSFVSLSSFCYAKKLGAMPSPDPPPGVVGPDYIPKGPHGIEF